MTSEIFANTSSAIKNNASTKIILDLSKTLELTELPEEAFCDCGNLIDITIPNSVITIGSKTFYGCNNLKSVIIPDSVESIGEYLFYACTNLTKVTISKNVTAIRDWTFYGCSSLESVTIPYNVTKIGKKVFTDCEKLTTVVFEDTESKWFYTENSDYTGGDEPLGVKTPTTNATNLKQYDELYGYKNINNTVN